MLTQQSVGRYVFYTPEVSKGCTVAQKLDLTFISRGLHGLSAIFKTITSLHLGSPPVLGGDTHLFRGVLGWFFFVFCFLFVFVVSLVCSMLTVSLECPNSIAPLAFSDVYFSSTDLHNITAILLKVAVKTQNPLTLLHTTSTSSSL